MKSLIFPVGTAVLALLAGATASAAVHLNIDVNPFGWGAPPPVVYESPRYYARPPVVYNGRGHWGDHREARGHDGSRSDHHDGADHRR